jgi:hypothetical protein
MEDKKTSREQVLAEKRRYWERHIQSWRVSGLSQTGYQRKHHLPKWQFFYWKRKFDRSVAFDGVSLVPISLPPALPAASLILVVNGRYRIEISEGFQPAVLEQVLRVVDRP